MTKHFPKLAKHIGQEVEEGATLTKTEFTSFLNYYNAEHTSKEAIAFLTEYVGEEALEGKDLSKAPDTLGWVARMLSRGVTLPSEYDGWLDAQIEKIPEKTEKTETKTASVLKDSLSDRVIAEIEGLLDTDATAENIIGKITSLNPNKLVFSRIITFYTPLINELRSIDSDTQLKEAYRTFTKKQIKFNIQRLENIIAHASNGAKRKTRSDKKIAPVTTLNKSKTVIIFNDNNLEVKIITGSPVLVGKKYQNYDTKTSYGKKVTDKNVEEKLKSASSYAEAISILRDAEGKELNIQTAVVNKYCRVIKQY